MGAYNENGSMLLVRQVATGIVVAAALAVLTLSVYQLSVIKTDPTTNGALASDLDEHARVFQEKLNAYSRRLDDLELTVIILLGVAGLYTVVFILSTDFNARGITRQVDRAMSAVTEQIGDSMADLRRMKDETRDALRTEVKDAAKRLDQHAHEMMRQLRGERIIPVTGEVVRELQMIEERIGAISETPFSDDQAQEILHYEGALPAVELLHYHHLKPQLARIYRGLAGYYGKRDCPRARFYLNRAAALAPDDFETANEVGFLALDATPSPDYRSARRHFEASLAAESNQQRAKYGLALIAKAEGDLETALGLLESAIESEQWETRPNPKNAALIHYALACVLSRKGQEATQGYRAQYLIRATEHLQEAFAYQSRQLGQMLLRDIEDNGDLVMLANTPPYSNAIDDLLLNLSVGAA